MKQLKFSEINENTSLYEQTDYSVLFDFDIQELPAAYNGILKMITPNVGVLNFGNSVGSLNFFGKSIRVESRKIRSYQYNEMLMYISEKMAELPFTINSASKKLAEITEIRSGKVLYHTFLILRYIILNADVNLEGAFEYVFRNPSRRREKERSEIDAWELSCITSDTLIDLAAKPERLVVLNRGSRLAGTDVSLYLSNGKPDRYFPNTVTSYRLVNTLDTPENRFIKNFLIICEDLLYTFKKGLSESGILAAEELSLETGLMIEKIETLLSNPFFDEIGAFSGFTGYSAVLQMRHGYKEILKFYNILQSAVRIPVFEDSIEIAVENKDIAELYEIWAFFKILELIEKVTGTQAISANLYNVSDYSVAVKHCASVVYKYRNQTITVWYNKSYSHADRGSYSLTMRPDIVVEIADSLYIFDAKFRLNGIDWDKDEESKGSDLSFRNDDIYKMHTYKDAIKGVKTACILYPNRDDSKDGLFWEDEVEKCSGVGAFSLVPDKWPVKLEDFIRENVIRIRNDDTLSS